MERLKGWKTYLGAAAVVIFSIAGLLGINPGMTQQQFVAGILGLVNIVTVFLRNGIPAGGWKTNGTAAVAAIFAFARAAGFDLGMTEEQFIATNAGLLGLVLAFLRMALKKQPT